MKVLAIDAACAACSAAVWADGSIAAAAFRPMDRGQAETLMPMVQDVIKRSGCTFDALELVAVTIGPGSFTGLRTGLAAARGIALARHLPLFGVTTLEPVALAARRTAPDSCTRWPITVVLDSRRTDLYAQQFDADLVATAAPFTAAPAAIAAMLPETGVLLAGDGAQLVALAAAADAAVRCVASAALPDAALVAEIAAERWDGRGPDPVPLYLRPPEAARPVAGGRLRP